MLSRVFSLCCSEHKGGRIYVRMHIKDMCLYTLYFEYKALVLKKEVCCLWKASFVHKPGQKSKVRFRLGFVVVIFA